MKNKPVVPTGPCASTWATQSNSGLDTGESTPSNRSATVRSDKFKYLKNKAKQLLSRKLKGAFSPSTNGPSVANGGSAAVSSYPAASSSTPASSNGTISPYPPVSPPVAASPCTAMSPYPAASPPLVASPQLAANPPLAANLHPAASSNPAAAIYLMRTGYGVDQSDYSNGAYPVTSSLDYHMRKKRPRNKPLHHDPFSIIDSNDPEAAEAAEYARGQDAKQYTAQQLEEQQAERQAELQADLVEQQQADLVEQQQNEMYAQQQIAQYSQS